MGRELTKDEQVHHKDGDRRNFAWTNLFILGEQDHGWVSSKQVWFMQNRDEKLKAEWDQFLAEKDQEQQKEIAHCKAEGIPYVGTPDGTLQRDWENRINDQGTSQRTAQASGC